MSDFLGVLAARALERTPRLEPRPTARFEPDDQGAADPARGFAAEPAAPRAEDERTPASRSSHPAQPASPSAADEHADPLAAPRASTTPNARARPARAHERRAPSGLLSSPSFGDERDPLTSTPEPDAARRPAASTPRMPTRTDSAARLEAPAATRDERERNGPVRADAHSTDERSAPPEDAAARLARLELRVAELEPLDAPHASARSAGVDGSAPAPAPEARGGARSAATRASAAGDTPDEREPVRVTIGRLEVRVLPPVAPVPERVPARAARTSPGPRLEDYLDEISGATP